MQTVLSGDRVRAVVSNHGAWLEELELDGRPLLFPKTVYHLSNGTAKVRGGCHVCLPNFGPDADGVLAQHGFARDMQWEVLSNTNSSLALSMQAQDTAYRGLESELTCTLEDTGITMTLKLTNNGTQELSVAPGFHPYFANEAPTIRVDDREYQVGSLDTPKEFDTGSPLSLTIGDIHYELESKNMTSWVVWTDRPESYVCLEPTQSGFSFAEVGKSRAVTIEPQQSQAYTLTIRRS